MTKLETFTALALLCLLESGCGREDGPNPQSAQLLSGMGDIHHAISTRNPEAQKFFDQGLALVYAFNFGEAVKSFRRAADLDPNAPMPYWGMALANAPHYDSVTLGRDRERLGLDFIHTAAHLAPKGTEQERAYVGALARVFSDASPPDQPKLARDYADGMRNVYHGYPDDPDAAALFAASLMNLNPWRLWTVDGQPGPGTPETVAVLEDGLRRWPAHTGLNHFYIRLMEGSPNPERALESANRLPALAPAAEHLLHMPSHIYLRTGDYPAAVKANLQAIAADEEYRKSRPLARNGERGDGHNRHFLALAASMDGEYETALNAAMEVQSHLHNEAMASTYWLVLLRFAKWDRILTSAPPDQARKGVVFLWHFARGCAFAGKGQLKEAADEQTAMEQAFAVLPQGPAFASFNNDWSVLHTLAADSLAARMEAAGGKMDAAIHHWRDAVTIEDQMNLDDVPDWYYPIRESLGGALLRNRQAAEAEQIFREDLKKNPRNPRSLFGLSEALGAQHKAAEAEANRQLLQSAWKGKEPLRLEDL